MGIFERLFAGKKAPPAVPVAALAPVVLTAEAQAISLIEQGNDAEDRGELAQALTYYTAAVEHSPAFARAHLNLGNGLLKLSGYDEALAAYARAIELNPSSASAFFNSGNALYKSGRATEALIPYRQAIALKADFADAYIACGNVYNDAEQYEAAVAQFRLALSVRPDQPQTYHNLGLALLGLTLPEQAQEAFAQAIQIDPGYSAAHICLGSILREQGHSEQAKQHYQSAVQFNHDDAEQLNVVGQELHEMQFYDVAILAFRKALKLKPEFAEAMNNMANSLAVHGSLDDAIQTYRDAIQAQPLLAPSHSNLGMALYKQGRFAESIVCHRRAIELAPEFYAAYNNMALSLKDIGLLEEAIDSYKKAVELSPTFNIAYSNYLFTLLHSERMNAQEIFAEHQTFGLQFESPLLPQQKPHANSRDPERILHIGFVSADLINHAVVSFIEPIFHYLAKHSSVVVHIYDNSVVEDGISKRMRSYARHWNRIGTVTDEHLAKKIRADKIDILIDLSGHTARNRLLTFARKPAPVQLSWVGYPGSTGMQSIDYFVGDAYFLPPVEAEKQFVEKIIRLPATTTFQFLKQGPAVNTLPALSNGYITFGSFNRIDKISREVIRLWAKLLLLVPDSNMVMGAMPASDQYENEKLLAWFAEEGIGGERLCFLKRSNLTTYLEQHHDIDVCLDTFPYTGGTTTNNALCMGVPTLTLVGAHPSTRQGIANLSHVGLAELFAANDEATFLAKGQAIAADITQLAEIRANLRARFFGAAVSDPELVAGAFDHALRVAWQRWCAQTPTASFEVVRRDGSFTLLADAA
ncbi:MULTISPECIES: tetratricopeptide repeat protein [unclassified Undibacterium]|uniref:tetratricopeptide repeat protein n=1 Tax=unclassified Undibacterium TaxID=2630295 RepID=UPI002AC8B320|nr:MULTISPECIES: tetratricopeptide repeat protein [unclassified Undibacterium]MEB0139362.1 tetratricopeptide repeat protein [Undibacterium sp. CCC2.1]MEB0173373.1 tetratricopeptide repeat protein [Undibacterium sp. CCC1.1]MEB0177240.1 tetratricopeptide repeat protein [Undibacterium sp. CCC3.4]MEB0216505.1 tetratricopeptide repeat protein [Undibacterium sp. 5I2]WPX44065.1 tetratricopeptide repeat protein [Undibacterium sp. CCC3.4]